MQRPNIYFRGSVGQFDAMQYGIKSEFAIGKHIPSNECVITDNTEQLVELNCQPISSFFFGISDGWWTSVEFKEQLRVNSFIENFIIEEFWQWWNWKREELVRLADTKYNIRMVRANEYCPYCLFHRNNSRFLLERGYHNVIHYYECNACKKVYCEHRH